MIFTQAKLDYLATQHIGRLATVSPGGQVQNNPTNFFSMPAPARSSSAGARCAGALA